MKKCETELKGWYKMRLIDADKFLKEILTAGIGKTIIEYSESDIGYMIRRQPTVGAAEFLREQWISVKNRLPDSNGLYIVTACDEGCAAGEGIWYGTVVVPAEYYNGCWTWYEGGHEYDLDGIVTHWMALPEPPQK